MPVNTYARTHQSSRFAYYLYQSSLYFLVVLISVVLLGSGYDIAQQVISSSRGPVRFTDTWILAGAYLSVAVASVVIFFSRLYSVRRVLASIPKGYLPLGRDELNKNLYRLVASEYSRCAMIIKATSPKGRTLPGWGAPGSDYAGVHFRSAILDTLKVLDTLLPSASDSSSPIPTKSKHASPLAKYHTSLIGEQALVPQAMLPLIQLYEQLLEDARWKQEEPTQADYENCLRIVAVLVDILNKRGALTTET